MTYWDKAAWDGFFKNAVEGRYRMLRCVAFAAYGSYPSGTAGGISATPIKITPEITFGLFPIGGNSSKPSLGLSLRKDELEEMVRDSLATPLVPLIWELSGGHVGVAHSMIENLCNHHHNKDNRTGIFLAFRKNV